LAVVLVNILLDLILLARHAVVVETFAIETIVLDTLRTRKVNHITFVKYESKLAIRSRAPRYVSLLLQEVFKLELLKLVVGSLLQQVLDVSLINHLSTLGLRTQDWELTLIDLVLDIGC
jgi:hypothetical protein